MTKQRRSLSTVPIKATALYIQTAYVTKERLSGVHALMVKVAAVLDTPRGLAGIILG
jgi:hypothetical protein